MPTPLRVKFTRQRVVIDLSFSTAFKVLLCFAVAAIAWYFPIAGLDGPAPRLCLVIFVAAAALWITELIPPYATAIMVIVSCVYGLGRPDGPLSLDATGERSWQMFVNPVASPVLVLLFSGFVLALGATKHGFDVRMARAIITPFGRVPRMLLLGVIATTGLFSMFMSNTATTAMMMAIVAPLLSNMVGRDGEKRMLVLAIPFAANIGGMGTIIGTPPNAVAASVLRQLGPAHEVSFLQWMLFGVPVVCVLLGMLWLILLAVYRPKQEPLDIAFPDVVEVTPGLAIVVVTFTLTVLLWLTEPLHHIPPAVVAMLPVAAFTAFGIISRDDLKSIDWDVLILVAGGMTLGVAMRESGLSDGLVEKVPFAGMPRMALVLGIMLASLVLANFMSHTSTSNLLVPIVTSLAVLPPRMGAIAAALACSLAMSLPISTPPNAIAFATRAVTTRDLAIAGSIMSAAGLAALVAFFAIFSLI